MEPYEIIKKLRNGEIVNLRGVLYQKVDREICVGDLYVAERNTGPKLLIAREIVPYPTPENGLKYGGWNWGTLRTMSL